MPLLLIARLGRPLSLPVSHTEGSSPPAAAGPDSESEAHTEYDSDDQAPTESGCPASPGPGARAWPAGSQDYILGSACQRNRGRRNVRSALFVSAGRRSASDRVGPVTALPVRRRPTGRVAIKTLF